MKILYVITKSNYGGAQRYVHELARALKHEHEVVVAFGGEGVLREKLEADGIRTIQIASFQRDISFFKELHSFGELWRLYQQECPDIVHLNSSKAGGSGALIARLTGVRRIIYTAHGWAFWEPRPFVWRALVWFFSWLTAILCHGVILVSQYEFRHTFMPFVRHKFSVIHTAVPDISFNERSAARNELFEADTLEKHVNDRWLVTVAELTHNKNLTTAIDAVAAYNDAHDTKIFYAIAGGGELHDVLVARIRSRGADSHITLLGNVDNARTYLHAFDMFLLPSKKEGMPYAVLEAGAAELPSIASNVGGIPEIIEDGKNGLLIDPNDHSTIVAALERLIDSPDERRAFGAALKEKVEQEFSLEQMVTQTKAIYMRSSALKRAPV